MKPRIAIAYDWLTTPYGGAEQVLSALHELYPEAPVLTTVHNPTTTPWTKGWQIKTSWLNQLRFLKNFHRWLLPFMPLAVETISTQEYDIILSVSSGPIKGLLTLPNQLHICYLLTPPRYIYKESKLFFPDSSILKWWPLATITRHIFNYLKWWDQASIARVDEIIPISQRVKTRIERWYRVSSQTPVYPPVTLPIKNQNTHQTNLPDKYLLVVSRLVPYKKIDVVIKAAKQTKHSLVIVGTGPELTHLQKLAREYQPQSTSKIIFAKNVHPDELSSYFFNSLAIIMPGLEDFGITALDSLAHGKPVILHKKSGAAELVIDGQTGLFLNTASVEQVVGAIKRLAQTHWRTDIMQATARAHSRKRFQHLIAATVNKNWRATHTNSSKGVDYGR